MSRHRHSARRRGGIYIAVLGTAMIVSLIGLASLATVRAQRLTATTTIDAAKARMYAQSGAQIGMQLIAADSNWRQNRTSGVWLDKQAIGDGGFSVKITDPLDGSLSNRPTDPVTIQGIGTRGAATQMVEATMVASGPPIDALRMALHTPGELHVESSVVLTASGAPVSTNGTYRSQGTLTGSVECLASLAPGTVTGTVTLLAPAKAMPDAGVEAMYVALGTAISPGSTIDRVALAPGTNPWGAANSDGLYVLTTSSDITIRRCRISGTLVVVCPGHTVTIRDNVFIQPARPDYPALIVDGNLILNVVSSSTLSESNEGTNFNPTGAPYLGVTDSDTSDTYPSEIDGLVHVKGTLVMGSGAVVRGAIICESAALTNAVDIQSAAQIIYDPTLYSSPPMGYMKSVTMTLSPGSWRQAVSP